MKYGIRVGAIEDFVFMCPFAKDKIVDWWMANENDLIVELKNGEGFYRYDTFARTFTYARRLEDLKRDVDTEPQWRLEFAKKLFRIMTQQGYSQDDLAYRTGISPASITKYVNGYSTPTIYKLIKIAEALDCTVNDLVYF